MRSATAPMAALAAEHGCSLYTSGTPEYPAVTVATNGDDSKPRTSASWLLSFGPNGEPLTVVMADIVGPLNTQTRALKAITGLLTDPRFVAVSEALARDIAPTRETTTSFIPPLNGEKTHDLSEHAKGVLQMLRDGPRPRREFNPGVVNRLLRNDIVETVDLPSPYKTHKGGNCEHLRITPFGQKLIELKN